MALLPSGSIAALMTSGAVAAPAADDPAARVQPASLDLTLGRRAWRIRASFLPSARRSAPQRLADGLAMHEIDLADGAVFERGCVYLAELGERLALPPDLSGRANPKSSTGRIDVFVRVVVEGGAGAPAAFDEIPAGYAGPLFVEIAPRTFSVVAREGSSLAQLRFRRGDDRLDDAALRAVDAATPLTDGAADIDGGLGLGVDLTGAGGPVGWRARRHAGLIDVDRVGALDPEAYFEPLARPGDGQLILDPHEFYILASRERLRVPPTLAAEMTAISPDLGEFRAHYAGFCDPGFGWSADAPDGGAAGARAVLEVRSHDAPFVLEHDQRVARLVFERLEAAPERLYGEPGRSHYQGQGLRLSKHFRDGPPA